MTSIIILATCVLHNFCLLNDDFLDNILNIKFINTYNKKNNENFNIKTNTTCILEKILFRTFLNLII